MQWKEQLIIEIKELWIKEFSSLNNECNRDGYFVLGFVIEAMKKLSEDAQPKDGWISVDDRLPEMSIIVYVKHIENLIPALAWRNYNDEWYSVTATGGAEDFYYAYSYSPEDSPITHWMALPPLPQPPVK